MKKALRGTGEHLFSILALLVHVFVSAVMFLVLMSGDIWQKLRRESIILVFGYGGDIADAVSAGVRGLFDPDYAREILSR
ncbi:MAG: hypothetical protein WBC83_02845 [Minisyncoccia bacterium]